jgi:DNA-binding beta-propeller fold protein YncE
MRPGTAGAILLLSVGLMVGCSSASPPARSTQTRATAGGPGAVSRPLACTSEAASGCDLGRVRTAMVPLPGQPFGVVTTADGRWSFVSLPGKIAVMSDRAFAPRLVRLIPVPGSSPPLGETLTRDGRYLLAAAGTGAAVVSVARAERGSPDPVLGLLSAPGAGSFADESAVEVATSPGDAFAFVTREYSDDIAVFDLRAALARHFRTSGFVGTVPLGHGPVGMAVSPDGRWLYVTSELKAGAQSASEQGTLSVIDLRRAETRPSESVLATAMAGCSPVRVAVSPNGRIVWVTARGSDALLGFSASRLLRKPGHALIAAVRVGEAPVGLVLVDHGRRILVANSNRFAAAGATSSLSVVDTPRALTGRSALLGSVRAGGFPREFSLEPNGRTLLVTNYTSEQLEAVNVGALP